jgi:hypothetical protein
MILGAVKGSLLHKVGVVWHILQLLFKGYAQAWCQSAVGTAHVHLAQAAQLQDTQC